MFRMTDPPGKKETHIRVTAAFPDPSRVIGGAGFSPDCRTVNGPKPKGHSGVFWQMGPDFRVFSTGTKNRRFSGVSKKGQKKDWRIGAQFGPGILQVRSGGSQPGHHPGSPGFPTIFPEKKDPYSRYSSLSGYPLGNRRCRFFPRLQDR